MHIDVKTNYNEPVEFSVHSPKFSGTAHYPQQPEEFFVLADRTDKTSSLRLFFSRRELVELRATIDALLGADASMPPKTVGNADNELVAS